MWAGILLLIAFPVITLVPTILAAVLERRRVWYFGDPTNDVPTAAYQVERYQQAIEEGFQELTFVRDNRNHYNVKYLFLVSPARDCLALIGAGTIWKIPVYDIELFTQTTNGQAYYSTDSQSCIESDLSGLWKSNLVVVPTFNEVWSRHREWIARQGVLPVPYEPGRELIALRKLRETRFNLLASCGLIRFDDESATIWRYTIWGGMKMAFWTHFAGVWNALFRNRGYTEGRMLKRR